jgi:death-on-curing family protein
MTQTKEIKQLAIYQAKNGAIEFRQDFDNESIVWANLNQIAQLFGRDKSVISRHIKNIFSSGELDKKATVAKIATVQKEGNREVTRDIEYFNLDVILSVGYRVDSKVAMQFRKWATKTLKQHITKGYTINKKVLQKNHQEFLQAVEDIKLLAKNNEQIGNDDILELIKTFSDTWFNLESYDKQGFPKTGFTKKKIKISAEELYSEIAILKNELIRKKEATELFANETKKGSLEGILGNVFQAVFGKEVYPTLEEKAAHLLYFIVKNHPFSDGNKRTGAFAFIWFLKKARLKSYYKITPEALTALTLLIAESNPKNKEKMVGLVLLLLKK